VPEYLAALRGDPTLGRLAEQSAPLAARHGAETADAVDTVLGAERLVLLGPPGAGKSTVLRLAAARLARGAGPLARVPVYVDLASARSGESVDDVVARVLGAHGLADVPLRALAPATLFLDNLERATDVYLLEGLDLFMRAGGHAGPAVVIACRSADWPDYRTWFGETPTAELQRLTASAVAGAVARALPEETAQAARDWLARDGALAAAVRTPITLEAFLRALRGGGRERWHRGRVMDALLDAFLAAVPQTDRPAYRAALTDAALGSLGQGALFEVDTLQMGLGVTRDAMIRTGAVVAHGPALEFVEPLLAQHCAAAALVSRTAADPNMLVQRLRDVPEARRAGLLCGAYGLSPDPVAFVEALMASKDGPELAARCLAEPQSAGPAGPTAAAVVGSLAARVPALPAAALYRLGEALARLGEDAATAVAVRAALERAGEVAGFDDVFDRADVDPAPPIAAWVRGFMAERNLGLALRRVEDGGTSDAALERAHAALRLLAADVAFEQGLGRVASGDTEGACAAFESALVADPDRARYRFHYGRMLTSLGRAAEAVEHLERARDLAPEQAEIEAALGEAHRARDSVEAALASFEAARVLAPHVAAYAQAVGELHAELGDIDAAADAMQQALAAQDTEAGWHDALGQILAERGQWRAALRAFKRAHARDSQSPSYLRHLGRAHLAIGETDDAVAALERAREITPDGAGILADLALALATAGRTEAAIDMLQQAVAIDDGWPADHLWLGRLLQEAGALDQALHHARRASDLAPASAIAQADLGRLHQSRGEYREAVAAFNRAAEPRGSQDLASPPAVESEVVNRDVRPGDSPGADLAAEPSSPATGERESPGNAGIGAAERSAGASQSHSALALDQLAQAYATAGEATSAMHVLDQALSLAPDALDPRRRAGQLCLELGRVDEAVAHLDRAAALAPEDAAVQHELAHALRSAGDEAGAIVALRRATQLAPDNPDYLADLTTAARALGRAREARAAVDAALVLAPGRGDLHAMKAEVEAGAGDPALGRAALREAVSLAPDEPAYRAQLADSLALAPRHEVDGAAEGAASPPPEGGHADDPLATARRAAAVAPASAAAHAALAEAYAGRGLTEAASIAIRQAAALAPEEPAYREIQARLALDLGRPDEAVSALEQGVSDCPNAAALHHALGCAYDAGGWPSEARSSLRRAAELAPDNPVFHRALGLHLAADDPAGAREALQQAIALAGDDAEAHYQLGLVEARAGDDAAALARFESAAGLAATEPAYPRALGECLARLGRPGAAAALHHSLALDPRSAATYAALGDLHVREGPYALALDCYATAAHLAPDVGAYWRSLGLARLARGDAAGAAEALRESLEREPEDGEARDALEKAQALLARSPVEEPPPATSGDAPPEAMAPDGADRPVDGTALGLGADTRTDPAVAEAVERAQSALAAGDVSGARLALTRAVERAPDDGRLHFWLGKAAQAADDEAGALRHLETAARLDSRSPDAFMALGELYRKGDALDDAIQAYQQAVVCDPEAAEGHLRLGEVCAEAGLGDKAEAHFRRAADLSPGDARPWHALGRAHAAAGAFDRAVDAYQAALARQSDLTPAYFDAGLALKELRQYGRAAEMFRQALRLAPSNTAAYAQYAAVSALNFLDRATHDAALDTAEDNRG